MECAFGRLAQAAPPAPPQRCLPRLPRLPGLPSLPRHNAACQCGLCSLCLALLGTRASPLTRAAMPSRVATLPTYCGWETTLKGKPSTQGMVWPSLKP